MVGVTLAPRFFMFFSLPMFVESQLGVTVVALNPRPLDVVVGMFSQRAALVTFTVRTSTGENHRESMLAMIGSICFRRARGAVDILARSLARPCASAAAYTVAKLSKLGATGGATGDLRSRDLFAAFAKQGCSKKDGKGITILTSFGRVPVLTRIAPRSHADNQASTGFPCSCSTWRACTVSSRERASHKPSHLLKVRCGRRDSRAAYRCKFPSFVRSAKRSTTAALPAISSPSTYAIRHRLLLSILAALHGRCWRGVHEYLRTPGGRALPAPKFNFSVLAAKASKFGQYFIACGY